MSVKRQKIELRKEMKAVLSRLDSRWLKAAGAQVCMHLQELLSRELKASNSHILCWSSFFAGEVDLTQFIVEQLGSRKVYLPRTQRGGIMEFVNVGEDWLSNLEVGDFGIPEPRIESGELFDSSKCADAVVLVPALAFDLDGNRVGRGQGYYDRFLARTGLSRATKIGVGWKFQLVREVPTESQDILLDYVCHEEGYVRTAFGNFDDL